MRNVQFHRSRRKRPTLKDAEQFLRRGIEVCTGPGTDVSAAERKECLKQLVLDLKKKVKAHLPRSRNLELVILKCHLVVEFMFNRYIDLMAPVEGVIESERFSFKVKESMVHMLGFIGNPCFFPTIDLLNSLRNSVAHTFTIDRPRIDQLIRINAEDPDDAQGLTDIQRAGALRSITIAMCWELLGFIEGIHLTEYSDRQDE